MRCAICNKAMSGQEIQLTPDAESFEPCSVCLEIAMDAAYSDGFIREEPLDDPEMEDEFGDGVVPTIEDPDSYRSYYDCCDSSTPDIELEE